MKLKRNVEIDVKNIRLIYNSLSIQYCGNSPKNIERYFSEEDNLKSFPPNGKLEVSELDSFFYIKCNYEIVGFYRLTNLFFIDAIELHGSFSKHNTFLIKSYFELTKLFVSSISKKFPKRRILSIAHKTNYNVIRFLNYLNFSFIGEENGNNNYLIFEKYLQLNVKGN